MKLLGKRHPRIQPDTLPERQARFYRAALERYRRKIHFMDFEEFAFFPPSPIYDGLALKADVLTTPLYLELRDMWLELGIAQGYVAPPPEWTTKRAKRRT
jgi:hypothetical protein